MPGPILLLTGPAASGKNTVARALSTKVARCAVVDAEVVRQMLVRPHLAPWEGEGGAEQHRLGVRNSSALARNFAEAGLAVVILDVVSDELAALYASELVGISFRCVRLLPSIEEVQRRNAERGLWITPAEVAFLYEESSALTLCDQTIDNTSLSADEVADRLVALIEGRVLGS